MESDFNMHHKIAEIIPQICHISSLITTFLFFTTIMTIFITSWYLRCSRHDFSRGGNKARAHAQEEINRCNTMTQEQPFQCRQRNLSTPRGVYLFIWVLTSLSTHCFGPMTTGSFRCRGNEYIQLVKVLYRKLPPSSKQMPAFLFELGPGFEPLSQRWEGSIEISCKENSNVDVLYRL